MASFQESPCYSPKFVAALSYAADIHAKQIRKQGNVPYLSHLLQVAGLVFEAGGSEDEAIAALLHDAIEDIEIPLGDIARWDETVAYIVGNLSERKETPKSKRKFEYVQLVAAANDSVQLVSAADKLHNLRCYAADGQHLWSEETAEFYTQLLPVYAGCDRVPRHWVAEMHQLLARLSEHDAEWRNVLFREAQGGCESAIYALEILNNQNQSDDDFSHDWDNAAFDREYFS